VLLLSNKHRLMRLAYAKAHAHWTEEQWSTVFYADETKINLHGPDGRERTIRRAGVSTQAHNCTPVTQSDRK
jgi:hypothetical protein